MIRALPFRILETLGLALLFLLAYGIPGNPAHGLLEAAAALALPLFLFAALFRGRNLGWIFLALFLGFAATLHWVPRTLALKGDLPFVLGLLGGALLVGWEALGLTAVAACARWARGKAGPWAAAACAGLALLLWERYGFHVYPWTLGSALGGWPWLARSAAFLGAQGLGALLWACGAWAAGFHASKPRSWRPLAAPAALLAVLLGLGALWPLLPRGPRRELDVVMIQPNFESGVRKPGMEQDMWRRTDAELRRLNLPRAGTATLVIWPESSVLGRDDRQPSFRLPQEAQRRGIAWLFGTEGGLLNLTRGEAAGQPSFIQGKIVPMPFGERMPGPPWLRTWLDRELGMYSQEPGALTADSSFSMPTPQGPLRVHPLLCSDALIPQRVQEGIRLAKGDLLVNQSNDGWFETSKATDLHAAQIRLRAVEMGLPLLRATLTGKSGIFREDGSWLLWGDPMTEAAYGFHLAWNPVTTPARSPWVLGSLMAVLALILVSRLFLLRP